MTDLARGTSPFDAIRHVDPETGEEYWMARELMPLLGYSQWRRFNDTINRAMVSVAAAKGDVRHHFSQVSQLADAGNLGQQKRMDFRLTRYACYLTAMNGDTSKREIAAAQTYFAVKARQAEVADQKAALPPVPQTFQQALRAYADEIDARERAELQAAEAKAEADMLRPPAEAWTHLVDARNDYDMATAAAILNNDPVIDTGPGRLRDWMLKHRMLYRRGKGQLVPFSEHLTHIRLKPQTRPNHGADDPRARKEAHAQVRITPEGLSWIQQRMREEAKPVLIPSPREPEPQHEISPATNLAEFRRKYERLRALYGNQ